MAAVPVRFPEMTAAASAAPLAASAPAAAPVTHGRRPRRRRHRIDGTSSRLPPAQRNIEPARTRAAPGRPGPVRPAGPGLPPRPGLTGESGGPEEFHPRAPTDPGVTVSPGSSCSHCQGEVTHRQCANRKSNDTGPSQGPCRFPSLQYTILVFSGCSRRPHFPIRCSSAASTWRARSSLLQCTTASSASPASARLCRARGCR
jgi:hypothetical protein